MATYGATPAGWITKRLADTITSLDARLRNAFGDGVNLTASSVFARLRGALAPEIDLAWQGLDDIWSSLDPDQAQGEALDRLCRIVGITRLGARASSVTLTLTGTPGTVVSAGFRVRDPGNSEAVFVTSLPATIGGGGTVDIGALSAIEGAIPALAASLTQILTPVAGVASCSNASPAIIGREVELDPELRVRRPLSFVTSRVGSDSAIRAALLQLNGVQQAVVLSNRGPTTDANGTPGHAFQTVIYPATGPSGYNESIAAVLYAGEPAGIRAFGEDVTYNVTDEDDYTTEVAWSWAEEVPIFIVVNVTWDGTAPSGLADQIKQLLLDIFAQARIGQDVINVRLVAAVSGIAPEIIELEILQGLIGPPSSSANIPIDPTKIATLDITNIAVNVI